MKAAVFIVLGVFVVLLASAVAAGVADLANAIDLP